MDVLQFVLNNMPFDLMEPGMPLAGAIPIALLAIVVDALLGATQDWLIPRREPAAVRPCRPARGGQFGAILAPAKASTLRYERHADLYRAFLLIAAAIICFRVLAPEFCQVF